MVLEGTPVISLRCRTSAGNPIWSSTICTLNRQMRRSSPRFSAMAYSPSRSTPPKRFSSRDASRAWCAASLSSAGNRAMTSLDSQTSPARLPSTLAAYGATQFTWGTSHLAFPRSSSML